MGMPLLATLSATYIGVLAPLQRSSPFEAGVSPAMATLAVVALLALAATPRSAWAVRIGIATAAGALVLVPEGKVMALWLPGSLLLAVWVVCDRPPLPFLGRCPPGSTLVAVFAAWFALRQGARIESSWEPLAVIAGCAVLMLVGAGRSVPFGNELHGFGVRLERWLQVAVVVPFLCLAAASRFVASAFVKRERGLQGGWLKPADREDTPRSIGRVATERARPRRWLFWMARLTAVAMIGWLATSLIGDVRLDVRGRVEFPSPFGSSARSLGVQMPDDPVPAAFSDSPWYEDFRLDLAWVTDERVAWRPMAVQRLLDVETATVNVKEGDRKTFRAPDCDCRRVSVWLYGGSGAFGLGQRDEHTVASELARQALADGVVLDVRNRGIPGQLHWRNATRFAWDLTVDPPPDVVLFYEGSEEVAGELALTRRGIGNTLAPFEPFLSELYEEVLNVPATPPDPPTGVQYVGWPRVDDRDREPGDLAAERYERSREMSRATADNAGIPVRYYWQPDRFSGSNERGVVADVFRGASDALADDVVDLSDVLAGTPNPVFVDDSNHNEVGASLVASAIWDDLRRELLPAIGG